MVSYQGVTARQVAHRQRWVMATVYVNRRRTQRRIEQGLPLRPIDFPVGTMTPYGLRWDVDELERFRIARLASNQRGGRPRKKVEPVAPVPPPATRRRYRRPSGQ